MSDISGYPLVMLGSEEEPLVQARHSKQSPAWVGEGSR